MEYGYEGRLKKKKRRRKKRCISLSSIFFRIFHPCKQKFAKNSPLLEEYIYIYTVFPVSSQASRTHARVDSSPPDGNYQHVHLKCIRSGKSRRNGLVDRPRSIRVSVVQISRDASHLSNHRLAKRREFFLRFSSDFHARNIDRISIESRIRFFV